MFFNLFWSWNVRGLGNRVKRASVKKTVAKSKPGVLFLQESKRENVDDCLISQICGRHHNFSFIYFTSIGASGGLISCWNESFFIKKSNIIHIRYIVLVGKLLTLDKDCALINIYALNNHSERRELWEDLRRVIGGLRLPVVLGGDFNIVRRPEEKLGALVQHRAMGDFPDFIEDLGLVDLPLNGGSFTWSSHREELSYYRLDKFLMCWVFRHARIDHRNRQGGL
ncbi:hypothetical protein HRI_004083700 [Hibiscus trionum]|uniref:Endonuclease/exonuclease/phosphatase domain-containing protein n=1 Tax=Hibiscus trionum TaxID=183268 RepID=A0A9W7IX18_HIBTR|nr:hypothetical protein HRI_004083700 [Hibiscus trionum]